MLPLVLALAALAVFYLARLRLRPIKTCRRCAGVGCHRCKGSGVRMRRAVTLAHRRQ